MTRAEQERLVERYLGGQMTSAQEEEFFIMVAVDHDLRQTLKAYRIVESAIRKHRDTAPIHHGASRARVIAMLNADAVANQHGGATAEITHHASRSMWGLSATAARWAVASVAATALVVGAFVVAPLIDHKADPVAGQLRITPAQQAPARQATDPVAPVTGISEEHSTPREITPLPEDGARTATSASETAAQHHASPDAGHRVATKEHRSTATPPSRPTDKPAAERNDTAPSMTPASKPAEQARPSSSSSAKPDGKPKVIDSAARVRVQIELPHQ